MTKFRSICYFRESCIYQSKHRNGKGSGESRLKLMYCKEPLGSCNMQRREMSESNPGCKHPKLENCSDCRLRVECQGE